MYAVFPPREHVFRNVFLQNVSEKVLMNDILQAYHTFHEKKKLEAFFLILRGASLTFWASSLTLVQSGFSAIHMKYSCKASSFWPASLRAVAFKQWACKNKKGLYSFDRKCIVFPSEWLATTARHLLTEYQFEIFQGIVLYCLWE